MYFDNNATTALDPLVFEAMCIDLQGPPANPSSVHHLGQRAKALLAQAREETASFFSASREEIFFTSGGTEGVNSLLYSLPIPGHLITTNIEHSCLYNTSLSLEKKGLSVTYVPVDQSGAPSPEAIQAAIRPDTKAIFLSAANTETGVRLAFEEIAQIAFTHRIPFFLDAVAFAGKEPLILHPGISACVISGHKFHGPKGVGAVFLRKKTPFPPLFLGGAQESGKRAGTENLPGILGLAKALSILKKNQKEITAHILSLRLHFESSLRKAFPDLVIHGEGARISSTSNLSFPGVDGETLLLRLDAAGICASHGSACSSGGLEPSRVLVNMGLDRSQVRGALRFSFGRMNTLAEVDQAISFLILHGK